MNSNPSNTTSSAKSKKRTTAHIALENRGQATEQNIPITNILLTSLFHEIKPHMDHLGKL